MKILLIIAFFMIFTLVFSLQIAYGDTILYGANEKTAIFVAFDGNLNKILYSSTQGISEHYDSEIKQYKHGGFFLKSPEIVIFGHPLGHDEYTLLVMTSNGFERFVVSDYHPIIKVEVKEEPKETSSAILEEAQKNKENTVVREADKEKEIIVEEVVQEILILEQMANKVSWYKNYVIDLKVFDPSKTWKDDYYNKDGLIEGVIIQGTIKDPYGNTLKILDGVTSKSGHFRDSIFFPPNSDTNGLYSVLIKATKQFDNGEVATYSLLKEFSVIGFYSSGGSDNLKVTLTEISDMSKGINITITDAKSPTVIEIYHQGSTDPIVTLEETTNGTINTSYKFPNEDDFVSGIYTVIVTDTVRTAEASITLE